MGSSDGYVLGATKIVDHGPDADRWNLVVLGDGYRASELPTYRTDVQSFVDQLRATPPFDELWPAVNVHRVDVVSDESGADDPVACGGTGATPATYFDATFCSPWGDTVLDRLLTCDAALVQSVAAANVPGVHQAIVAVNSSTYGGSGGEIAVFSTHPQAGEIAIHEIGHSAFGLADEYEADEDAPATEPDEPNVTLDPHRATNKWRDLVLASTPMPTRCNAACTTSSCTPPATPASTALTGAWEGGRYASCNVYRPAHRCYMRDFAPFCAVCSRTIRGVLGPFLPAESITLVTPTIRFRDIPEGVGGTGVTTWRAVRWDVVSGRSITFTVTAGPTGPFTLPQGPSVTVGASPYTPSMPARLMLQYTSTTAGQSASGSVTVRCQETGQVWTIPIDANTVPRKRAQVALVLDRSGSMTEDAGDGTTKIGKLREAARIFLEVMLPGDGIGLVRFSNNVRRLKDVEDVGALVTGAGRVDAIDRVTGPLMDPAGRTAIGGALLEGTAVLADGQAAAATSYEVEALVVLTDGLENEAPYIDDVADAITAHTYAIGLGLPYNVDAEKLSALAGSTDGYLLVTGVITPEQRMLLAKYFLQVLAGITNAQVALDPHGELGVGEEHRVPFLVTEADHGLDALVLATQHQGLVAELESPDGTRFDAAAVGALGTGTHVVRDDVGFYRIGLPLDPGNPAGTHDGTWHVVLRLDRERLDDRFHKLYSKGYQPYDVLAHTWSSLVLRAGAHQDDFTPTGGAALVASLTEYDVDVADDRARVWAEVARPDGSTRWVDLAFRDGAWMATYRLQGMVGVHRIRLRAAGYTFAGTPFAREQTLTAYSFTKREGRDLPEEPEPGDRPDPWDTITDRILSDPRLRTVLREHVRRAVPELPGRLGPPG